MIYDHNSIKIGPAKLGHGAFGEIYQCHCSTTGATFAIKLEKKSCVLQLHHEFEVYKKLENPNFPKVYGYGKIEFNGALLNYMMMEYLGPSLEKMYNLQGRKFSVKTLFMIAKSCIKRAEFLHFRHYVHRDIKPDNFLLDTSRRKIYMIDYGLAKEYRDPNTLVHRPIKTGKNLTGTARYASLNTHLGIEQSRRDDLESIGIMLIYFARGSLPWQGLKAKDKYEKYEKIKKCKQETSLEFLCSEVPDEFYSYMNFVRNLQYDECPDYALLISIFENGLRKLGLEDDGIFDWLES